MHTLQAVITGAIQGLSEFLPVSSSAHIVFSNELYEIITKTKLAVDSVNQEEIFFLIPLETLKFLNDCLKEQVIKIYIYLGQRWKYKQNDYTFTLEEIAEHIGIKLGNNQRNYDIINNALICLVNNGLIDYVEYFENNKPRKRLADFSLVYKRPDNGKNCG